MASKKICILLCIGYLIAGLWPFNFYPRNKAHWAAGGKGLHFEPLAVAASVGSIDLGSPMPGAEGKEALQFSIELLISAESEVTEDSHSLFAIYDGALPENLLAAQWQSSFLLRIPVIDAQGKRQYREIGVDKALIAGKQRIIAITSGSGGTSLYVDGSLAESYPRTALRPGSLHGVLMLGGSPKARISFTGTFHGLALFNRTLGAAEIDHHAILWKTGRASEMAALQDLAGLYLFDAAQGNTITDLSQHRQPLMISKYYRAIHKTLFAPLKSEWHRSLSDFQDIFLNIFGFVPFGFFCFIWFRGTGRGCALSLVIAILLSGIISTVIEVPQAFLPTRSSSLRDLICNIGGGLIGAVWASRRQAKANKLAAIIKHRKPDSAYLER
jgi:VanZ family protein